MTGDTSPGTLYVVATPIGNLGDMTLRAIEVLQQVSAVYSEDTRVSRRLFNHFGIDTPLKRFDDRTSSRKIPEICTHLKTGADIALISDAGTPTISDPGMPLVAAARADNIPVTVVPGASAAVAALSISGLPAHAYYFGSFLPRKKGKCETLLQSLDMLNATLIFFESPHRIVTATQHLAQLYPNRQAVIARELTKHYEEVLRGNLEELSAELTHRQNNNLVSTLRGEFVILLAPLKFDGTHTDGIKDRQRQDS
ncbi:MAG: 16S rRNA (cytidine(1402)-2'-O)-methyltransferase [Coriobacteriia bacterium]|nr:16S rRNA (cytidine(1402)-2'-O)-methyltransferase [Coriobacteriia bacterium]